jgi:HEAT repeat protein
MESLRKAPILFATKDEQTKRGAYKLMKTLLGALEYPTIKGDEEEIDGIATSKNITQALSDVGSSVRQDAVESLTKIGSTDQKVQDSLYSLLTDENPEVRQSAIEFFTEVGSTDQKVREIFCEFLSDKQEQIRLLALECFLKLWEKEPNIQTYMGSLLENKDPLTRSMSIQFFRQIGSNDPLVHQGIAQVLHDDDQYVRLEALNFFSFVGIADSSIYDLAAPLINDPVASVRAGAIEFLSSRRNRKQALESIDLLSRNLEDEQDSSVRQYIKEALIKLLSSQENKESFLKENIIRYLKNEDISIRKIAKEIMEKIDKKLLEATLIDSIHAWIEKGNIFIFQKENEFSICIRTSIHGIIEDLKWEVGIQKPSSDNVESIDEGFVRLLQESHIKFSQLSNEKGEFKILITIKLGGQERSFIEKVRCIDYNPYHYGGPIREEMFFGRKELVEEISQGVSKSNYLIPGERKIGKTSLLLQLEKIMEKPLIPVLVDLSPVTDETFFLAVMSEIYEKCKDIIKIKPNFLFFSKDKYGYMDYKRDLSKLTKQLKNDYSRDVIMVLLLDEADRINDLREQVQNGFRSMITLHKEINAVITGTLRTKSMSSDITSPWYNAFMWPWRRIGPLTRKEAIELITTPTEGLYSFSQEAINLILSKSGYKPWIIQAFCKHVVEKILSENRNHIEIQDVQNIADETLLKNNFQIYQNKWNRIGDDIKSTLLKVANGAYVEELDVESKTSLKEVDFVDEGTNKMKVEPLFLDWIRRNCI